MPEIGLHNYKGTGVSFWGLASEDYGTKSITVDGDTRDTGNINTDDLRAGMCLEMDSTTKKYKAFTSDHTSLVILGENLYDLALNGDQVAMVFVRGRFKRASVIEPASVTWTSAQRFIIDTDSQ